jgi:disulfide oxidoreductase YuzD
MCAGCVEVKKKKDNSDWVVAQLWNLEFEKLNSKKGQHLIFSLFNRAVNHNHKSWFLKRKLICNWTKAN